MAKFSKDHQPANRGRPKGSKNRRSVINEELQNEAVKALKDAVLQGESWAISAILDRTMPKFKQVTPPDSIDGEFLRLKMKEVFSFEQRLTELEKKHEQN